MSPNSSIPRSKGLRLGRRIAVVAVAVAVLAIIYQLTRPPELVWWTSPPIGVAGKYRIRALVPNGWVVNSSGYVGKEPRFVWIGYYSMFPADHRPSWLRRILPSEKERCGLRFDVVQAKAKMVGIISQESFGATHQAPSTVLIILLPIGRKGWR